MNLKNNLIKKIAVTNESVAEFNGKIRFLFGITENVINKKPAKFKKKPRICIVYLLAPGNSLHSKGFMGNKKRVTRFHIFKKSLKTTLNYLPNYPIIIFYENYDKKKIFEIKRIIGEKTSVLFIKVDFKKYKNKKNLEQWVKKQKSFVEGRPVGYRMMCRFFSGILQNHPTLDNFDYYIRMDDDSFFIEPKGLDVDKLIKKYDFDYLYRSVWTDHKEKEKIWEFTKNYAKKNNLSLDGFKKLSLFNSKKEFNGRSAYNNFHISKISFWRRKDVKNFLNEIEKVDGSVIKHWHDTTIHSMLLGLFNATVVEKTNFGYRHNDHYSLLGSLKIKYKK